MAGGTRLASIAREAGVVKEVAAEFDLGRGHRIIGRDTGFRESWGEVPSIGLVRTKEAVEQVAQGYAFMPVLLSRIGNTMVVAAVVVRRVFVAPSERREHLCGEEAAPPESKPCRERHGEEAYRDSGPEEGEHNGNQELSGFADHCGEVDRLRREGKRCCNKLSE
jgi:hypothetical protein